MKFFPALTVLAAVFFCTCQDRPLSLPPVYILPAATEEDPDLRGGEEALLMSVLETPDFLSSLGLRLASGAPEEAGAFGGPAVTVEFRSSWEFEDAWGEIPLSRTYYVPQEDPLARRRNTSLAACLAGEETLIPLAELNPPGIALRVEGRSVGDEGYPLVRIRGIRVREQERSVSSAAADPPLADKAGILREALYRRVEALPNPLLEERPAILQIAAAGDLMLGRGAEGILLQEGPLGIFGGTTALLRDADFTVVNLEGVLSRRGTRTEKAFNFRFNPGAAAFLRDAGIDAVLQANNHAFDWGPDAFLDTLDSLAAAGIGALGAGRDEAAAAAPLMFTGTGGLSVRCFGLASFPRERSGWDGLSVRAGKDRPGLLHAGRGDAERIKAGFDPGALNAVFFHGGEEWSSRPDRPTRELCTDLVRAGADLVIGSHPHIVQGFEWVEGKPVFWSLGNYVFAGMENTGGGDEGLFLVLGFWGKRLLYLEPYALALSGPRTEIAPPERLDRFYELSRELISRNP
ncbi:MAG: CapA family protein [Spirochaetaceae bacterium]|jgi:poly-gamma-glutamate synthesis protein (capsule biosynthesis protein)|nr:CapA family protein [Spirochaetaceae bacterium]